MIKFPDLGKQPEPPQKKMTSEEYVRFCEFCLKSNPHITTENCLQRITGEEHIKIPFRL